jgi:amidase
MSSPGTWLDATAQAELVARGEASPRELVDDAIARVEALNPALNAVIHERFDRAREEARALPESDSPLRGVPFLVKDAVCHTAGDPFHCGMRLLKRLNWIEKDDTWLAARFRAAGFVFVGKTNTPELATSVTTEPLAYGASHNPWDPSRSTGGSSGGSAAAVASGMVAVAHGNDMGGSIRFPRRCAESSASSRLAPAPPWARTSASTGARSPTSSC